MHVNTKPDCTIIIIWRIQWRTRLSYLLMFLGLFIFFVLITFETEWVFLFISTYFVQYLTYQMNMPTIALGTSFLANWQHHNSRMTVSGICSCCFWSLTHHDNITYFRYSIKNEINNIIESYKNILYFVFGKKAYISCTTIYFKTIK